MGRVAAACAVLASACPGPSGPVPNATYFWQMLTSELSFGQCSDDSDFRASSEPLDVSQNAYIIYKVSADGQTAVAQRCTALDAATCTPSTSGLSWAIAGHELTFTTQSKDPIGTGGCMLEQTQTWTLVEQTRKAALTINNVLTLVDAPAACSAVEEDLKLRSGNHLGVEGCVVTFRLTGELR